MKTDHTMKFNIFTIATIALSASVLTACYEDKGNYTYSDIEEVTVEFPANISAMERSENLVFAPVVTSSLNGTIKADDPNYEYTCRLRYQHTDENGKTQYWYDINPDKTKDINFMPDVPASSYSMWYTVTNKNTGVTHNFKGSVSIISTTSEGWMVLSNNGAEKRVRLDMVYTDSKGEQKVRKGVFPETSPEIFGATSLIMRPAYLTSTGDRIMLTANSGSYMLNSTTLAATEGQTIRNTYFASPSFPGEVITHLPIYNAGTYEAYTDVCVTTEGNCYGIYTYSAGASFEFVMNTDQQTNDPTYKVSPFIGSSQARPGNSAQALFYDITNKRFMVFNRQLAGNYASGRVLYQPQEPENANYSFVTGMDIVDMESTRFSDGEVFAVLQDNTGHRHVYGVMVNSTSTSTTMQQGNKYSDIYAESFDDADDYAFHSQYPFMFYCKGNKVYCYDLGTRTLMSTLQLNAGERVTKLKFNLYQAASLNNLNNQSEDFMNMQFKLIVCSTTGGEDGGIVRFYDISSTGQMTQYKEFTGFGEEIVDVTYRKRSKS